MIVFVIFHVKQLRKVIDGSYILERYFSTSRRPSLSRLRISLLLRISDLHHHPRHHHLEDLDRSQDNNSMYVLSNKKPEKLDFYNHQRRWMDFLLINLNLFQKEDCKFHQRWRWTSSLEQRPHSIPLLSSLEQLFLSSTPVVPLLLFAPDAWRWT